MVSKKSKYWAELNPTEDELRCACWDIAQRKAIASGENWIGEANAEQVWWDAGGDISDEIAKQVRDNRGWQVGDEAKTEFNERLRGL